VTSPIIVTTPDVPPEPTAVDTVPLAPAAPFWGALARLVSRRDYGLADRFVDVYEVRPGGIARAYWYGDVTDARVVREKLPPLELHFDLADGRAPWAGDYTWELLPFHVELLRRFDPHDLKTIIQHDGAMFNDQKRVALHACRADAVIVRFDTGAAPLFVPMGLENGYADQDVLAPRWHIIPEELTRIQRMVRLLRDAAPNRFAFGPDTRAFRCGTCRLPSYVKDIAALVRCPACGTRIAPAEAAP
jgi:hypothetical protein